MKELRTPQQLTDADVAPYEARAAKGEPLALPWYCYPERNEMVAWVAVLGTTAARIYKDEPGKYHACFSSGDGDANVEARKSGYFTTVLAAQHWLEDCIADFTKGLLLKPFPGPFRAAGQGRLWAVMHKEVPTVWADDQAEAEAIARVRNEAWRRRQKEKQ